LRRSGCRIWAGAALEGYSGRPGADCDDGVHRKFLPSLPCRRLTVR
jgi:hypothetical protein